MLDCIMQHKCGDLNVQRCVLLGLMDDIGTTNLVKPQQINRLSESLGLPAPYPTADIPAHHDFGEKQGWGWHSTKGDALGGQPAGPPAQPPGTTDSICSRRLLIDPSDPVPPAWQATDPSKFAQPTSVPPISDWAIPEFRQHLEELKRRAEQRQLQMVDASTSPGPSPRGQQLGEGGSGIIPPPMQGQQIGEGGSGIIPPPMQGQQLGEGGSGIIPPPMQGQQLGGGGSGIIPPPMQGQQLGGATTGGSSRALPSSPTQQKLGFLRKVGSRQESGRFARPLQHGAAPTQPHQLYVAHLITDDERALF